MHGKLPFRERDELASEVDAMSLAPASSSWLYDRVLSPFYDRLAAKLWPTWLHPNQITLLGGACGVVCLVAMEHGWWRSACLAFTSYHACDNMDGKHARRTGKTSHFGHALDHAIDGTIGFACINQIFLRVVLGGSDHSLVSISPSSFQFQIPGSLAHLNYEAP